MNWLETSFLARLITETLWGFPINEVVHILAFSTLVGGTVAVGLHLLGIGRIDGDIDERLFRYVRRIMIPALLTAFLSGLIFFAANPSRYTENTAFLIKMPLLLVFVTLLFWTLVKRKPLSVNPSLLEKWIAIALLIGVVVILACGRLIAYA